MSSVRNLASVSVIVAAAIFVATWLAVESRAQAPEKGSIAGVWTLNNDLSDQPPARSSSSGGDGNGQGRRSGGEYGRGMGRGGYGGGMGRGGGGGRAAADPEEAARMRDAMRDILNPPDHLTIVQTDSMVVLTGPDGRTTRLSPDGKKVKDDNTGIERKTHWNAGKLVSEVNGAGPGKITQTISLDAEHHQLRISAQLEGGRSNQPRTFTQVYDSDGSDDEIGN
jgi:hypothetical protein